MSHPALDKQVRSTLSNASISLLAYGHVQDQSTGNAIRYNPTAITNKLQSTIVSYFSNPPLTADGQVRWLVLLGYRQAGKSTAPELCAYAKTAYTPGWDHVCIADTRNRAEYLHGRVHFCHNRWPEAIRSPTHGGREVRQLTFDPSVGGKMRVLSGESGAVGIGQSPDSFHGSEIPFWGDAERQFSLIFPSMINRDHSLMLLEATPWEADSWWHDRCTEARYGDGRWVYAFFPFWDGKLNRRPWKPGDSLDNTEVELMNRYGKEGLTLENIAFRRLMMDTDPEIRRDPDLFRIFYPLDDVSCWLKTNRSVIHPDLLEKHSKREMKEWHPSYMEYEAPCSDSIYVIGVDPAGHAARDHASFQVLKVEDGHWEQVACYADHTEPVKFTERLISVANRYNRALVCVESNGVGAATIALLVQDGYPNLFHEKPYKPGFTSTTQSIDKMLGWLQDALRDELVFNDKDTYVQLTTYRHDKRVEDGVGAEMLRGGIGKKRRSRHHWDKISALQMAVVAARNAPRRIRKPKEVPDNVVLFKDMSWDQVQEHRKKTATDKPDTRRRKVKYRRVRRRRK